jgi:hypothetical protein
MFKHFKEWYFHVLLTVSFICLLVLVKYEIGTLYLILMSIVFGMILMVEIKCTKDAIFFWRYSTISTFRYQGEYYHYGLPKAHHAMRTENNWKKERIVGVTIRHPTGLIFAGYEPLRHHNVICAMDQKGMAGNENTRDQGFITNTGRHVCRIEASFIAEKAGQVQCLSQGTNRKLFSEDVWP